MRSNAAAHAKFRGTVLAQDTDVKRSGPIIMAVTALLFAGSAAQAIPLARPGLPDVLDVQREALRQARFDVAEVASWMGKARLAAYVPKVQLELGKRLRSNINVGVQDNVYVGASGIVVGPEEGDYSNVHTDDFTIGMRAVWELGAAVFNSKQLAVSAELRRVVKERSLLLADVNRHYYNVAGFQQQASLMRKSPAASKKPEFVELKVFQLRISCKESAAQLDALTGGWFTRSLEADNKPCSDSGALSKGG